MSSGDIIGHRKQMERLSLMKSRGMLPNALLFSGISGIGKRKIAENFIASLYCEKPDASSLPCGDCHSCSMIKSGTFPDFILLSPDDKGKIPIGNPEKKEPGSVRWLLDRLSRKTVTHGYGVVIDGVDTISREGQNALLKTIEEPPGGTLMILVCSNRSNVLPTIRSRCSDMQFHPLSEKEVGEVMALEGVSSPNADLIASICGGSVESAVLLSDSGFYSEIMALCSEISDYIEKRGRLALNFTALQKKAGMEPIISILTNLYRAMLVSDVCGKGDILTKLPAVSDRGNLIKLIKILLALRKGFANNLNIRNAMKGMLYSMDSMDDIGLPDMDFNQ